VNVYQAVFAAGQEFGMRRLGVRAFGVNHVEACFPTIAIDYIPAMFGERESRFLNEYVMPSMGFFATMFQHSTGSMAGRPVSDFYRSPVELGWGKSIKFDHEFVGRQALEAEVENPVKKIVTLEWDTEDVLDLFAALFRDGDIYELPDLPRSWGTSMFDLVTDTDGNEVGTSSSRCHSVFFRKMLSLCVIDADKAEPGTPVHVLWGSPSSNQKTIRATVAPAPYKQDNRRADLAQIKQPQ
jgi:vanillate/3-O-methylgallate O-demethylase